MEHKERRNCAQKDYFHIKMSRLRTNIQMPRGAKQKHISGKVHPNKVKPCETRMKKAHNMFYNKCWKQFIQKQERRNFIKSSISLTNDYISHLFSDLFSHISCSNHNQNSKCVINFIKLSSSFL